MRRIIMVATVALVMAAMWVAMAMPAFTDGRGGGSGGFGGGGRCSGGPFYNEGGDGGSEGCGGGGSSFDRP
jgi:hypothetical protein